MQLPTNRITPALKILSEKIKILPATGGAVEDLQHPDEEELEDALIHRETREITEFAETPTPSIEQLYRPTPPLFRAENHLYRLFIDGSLRTYYLATGIEQNRSFPIELAQIGAAVMKRDDNGRMHPLAACRREQNSNHGSRQASTCVVQRIGKSAGMNHGRRQNSVKDGLNDLEGVPVPSYAQDNVWKRLRLKAKQIRHHSPAAAAVPRKENWRKPRTSLMIPITGSTVHLRAL